MSEQLGGASIAGGAAAGVGVSAVFGHAGLAVAGTAVGIGTAPMAVAGGIVGAAAYGAFEAIATGDKTAIAAFGLGALGGVGVSSAVGGMGLAGGFGAFKIGMGTMGIAGGIVGLGIYGVAKMLDSGSKEPAAQVFSRMEEKIAWKEAYIQALLELELEAFLRDYKLERQFMALDFEDELQMLKAELKRQNAIKAGSAAIAQLQPVSKPRAYISLPSSTPALPQTDAPKAWICVHTLKHHAGAVNAIAISPDSQTLATASDDRTILLWDLETGKPLYAFFQPEPALTVAISANGKTLVSGGLDKTITRWRLETKQFLDTLSSSNSAHSHSGFVYSLAMSADGKTLVSGSADNTIRVWRYDDRTFVEKLKRTLNGHTDTVFSVAISANGSTLVSGSADRTIRVWNLTRWEHPRILTGHSGWVNSIAISPDGQTIASASADSTIKLWNLQTGELLCTLEGHLAAVISLSLSPGGRILASSSKDGTVKLWKLQYEQGQLRGKSLHTLPGNGPATFSPDGRSLVIGGKKGTVKVWRLYRQH